MASDQAEYPPELSRLPPGRHGLPRDFVVFDDDETGLFEIDREMSETYPQLSRLSVLCDVRTPFEDAPKVFGPQKGADEAMVRGSR